MEDEKKDTLREAERTEIVIEQLCDAAGKNFEMVEFSTLEERVGKTKPELLLCLSALKEQVGAENFEKYFNTAHTLNTDGRHLLLVSDTEMKKTLIEKEFLPALKEAFGVENIRVVGKLNSFYWCC